MSTTPELPPIKQEDFAELISQMKKSNELISTMIANSINWKIALRNGILAGLGGVVGASLVVSLLLYALKPLERLEGLKPYLDEFARNLRREPVRQNSYSAPNPPTQARP